MGHGDHGQWRFVSIARREGLSYNAGDSLSLFASSGFGRGRATGEVEAFLSGCGLTGVRGWVEWIESVDRKETRPV